MKKSAVCFFIVLAAAKGFSQLAMTNAGPLRIHSGASLAAFGNVTNNSGAALVNDGSLYVKGNIANNEVSMSSGAGTLYLNGTSMQTLSGAQAFKTLNLSSANSAGITLNNNLSVAGVHTFSPGIITTSSTAYLIYEAGSSYSAAADNAHVNGWVRKSGSTAFNYPVGNGTFLRTVTTTNLSAASVFNARYEGATTNVSNLMSPLFTANRHEMWSVVQTSGGTAQVILNWDASKVTSPDFLLADMRASNYLAGNWTSQGGSGTGNINTTGSVTSNSISTFGLFTISSISASLPLHTLDLSARRVNHHTLVQWTTTDEINVDLYEVQRSEMNNFITVGSVPAKNGQENHYEFNDPFMFDGTAYYRIKRVDRDGISGYSAIVAVTERSEGAFTVVNPVRSEIKINVTPGVEGDYKYELLSVSGAHVQKGNISIYSSTAKIPLSPSVLRGTYVLKLMNEKREIIMKLIVN
jgi:hypothetical protein